MNAKTIDLRIGKNGLTDSVLQEITHTLKKKKIVKIKLLKAALPHKQTYLAKLETLPNVTAKKIGFTITLKIK